MRPVLVLVVQQDFAYDEYQAVITELKNRQQPVVVGAPDTTWAQALNDSMIKPDVRLSDVQMSDYRGLVLIGGIGSVLFWNDSLVRDKVREFARGQAPIGAIGLAPIILARNDLLTGHTATVYRDAKAVKMLAEHGARFRDRDVVVSGRFVTASSADAAGKMVPALIALIESR